jgi:hypothetical protein
MGKIEENGQEEETNIRGKKESFFEIKKCSDKVCMEI